MQTAILEVGRSAATKVDSIGETEILDVAEGIVRSRGYNAFSYADVASIVGLSKASLHHHFPTKADLGLELITRFEENVLEALAEIDKSDADNVTKLREYGATFEVSLLENKMCLCGMLAAEHETLSDEMQTAISVFFERNEAWVAGLVVLTSVPLILHRRWLLRLLRAAEHE